MTSTVLSPIEQLLDHTGPFCNFEHLPLPRVHPPGSPRRDLCSISAVAQLENCGPTDLICQAALEFVEFALTQYGWYCHDCRRPVSKCARVAPLT